MPDTTKCQIEQLNVMSPVVGTSS